MRIGDRIKNRRKALKYTQKELANRVNVSSQVISNWERGYTNLDHEDIQKISKALDVTTDYLLGNTDDPNRVKNIHEDAPEGEEVHFDNDEFNQLNDEQKQKVYDYIKFLRWEAEQYNKENEDDKKDKGKD